MTIRFRCSAGHKLTVPDDLAGRNVRCPTCREKIVAPSDSQENAARSGREDPEAAALTLPFPDAAANDAQNAVRGKNGEPGQSAKATQTASEQPRHPVTKPEAAKPEAVTAVPFPDEAPTNHNKAENKAENKADAAVRSGVPFPEAATSDAKPSFGSQTRVAVAITADGEYEPDTGRLQTTYLLAIAMSAVSLLAAAPALPHLGIIGAPVWALALLIMLLVHVFYISWAVSLPDWSTVWIGGVVFTATSIAYAGGAVLAGIRLGWLGLPEARGAAIGWTASMAALFAIVAYACWRFASGWRRDFELGQSSGGE